MTAGDREAWRADTRMEVAAEVEAATGMGITAAHKLLRVATAPRAAVAAMRELMRSGKAPLHRVEAVLESTADMEPEVLAEIGDAALRPRRDGAPQSQQQFRRILRREVAKRQSSDQAAVARARAQARAARRVSASLEDDGSGSMTVSGSAERVVAAHSRVDQIARRFRRGGDERTLD